MTGYGYYVLALLVIGVLLAAVGYPAFFIGVCLGLVLNAIIFRSPLFKDDE